jgi:L-aspartate oxidase
MRRTSADHVLLDCTAIRDVDLAARFPGIYARCRREGIDIRSEPIPVAPAAHYLMGGVRTDTHGRTTVEGLYACGECACTGVHGANRLASNSLMETVVFGKRVVEHIVSGAGGACAPAGDVATVPPRGSAIPREDLQRLMWEGAGIERDARGLQRALDVLGEGQPAGETSTRAAIEDANLTIVAAITLRAALEREESRGAHFRADFPAPDDRRWRRHLVYRRAG